MLELLGAFGLDTAIVQRADARPEHFNAVWTFNLLFGLGMGIVVACLAWPAAWLYGDPRLVPVMYVLALRQAVQGFENVGVIAFRKEMSFEKEFKYLITRRLATSIIVTLPLAFLLRNYWALLAGSFMGTCIGVAFSYFLHPYRPRLSLKALGQLMNFSKWLFVTNLVDFVYGRVSDLVVGGWAGPAALGSLAIARDVAGMASHDLAAPIHRAVFPGYVKLSNDRALLRAGYLKVTSVVLLLIVPGAVGLTLLAEPIVLLLLGDKWTNTVPLIQILSINGAISVLVSTAHYANLAVGMARSTSLVLATHACFSIPLLLWWVPLFQTQGAAYALLAASIATSPFNFYLLAQTIQFGARELFDVLSRPIAGSLVMSVALLALRAHWGTPSAWQDKLAYLMVAASAGALVYAGSVFLLWRRKKDPDSAESWVMGRAAQIFRSFCNR
jgi:O-antigen/teichoic acid export membrane protein